MTISYQYTKADWIAFYRYSLRHTTSRLRAQARSCLAFVPFALILFAISCRDLRSPSVGMGLLVLAFLAWMLFFPRAYQNHMVSRFERGISHPDNAGMFGLETMTLTAEHVHTKTPRSELTIPWGKVIKAERTDDHVFVYISALEAVVVPRESLEGASFDEVWGKINEYMSHGRNGIGTDSNGSR